MFLQHPQYFVYMNSIAYSHSVVIARLDMAFI